MVKLSFVMVLMVSTISFGQIAGFRELKKNFFFKSVNTQEKAVATYNMVMSSHGSDTTKSEYTLDRNPLIFSSLLISDKKVLSGFIIKEKDLTYSILFYYIKNEITYFFDIEDVDGVVYEMVYEPKQ
jgi:hypothetical protein